MAGRTSSEIGSWLRRLLAPPVLDDVDKTGTAQMNLGLALTIAVVGTLSLLVAIVIVPSLAGRWLVMAAVGDVICLVIIVLTRRGLLLAAGWFQTIVVWALITLAAVTAGGVDAPSISLQLVVVVVAVMVLGRRAGFATAALCIATVVGIALIENAGVLPASRMAHTPVSRALTISAAILMVAVMQSLIGRNLRIARDRVVQELVERRAAERFSDTIIDSSPGYFVTLDGEGRFLRWNQRIEVLTGISGEQLKGMSSLELVHEDDRALVAQKMAEILESGSGEVEARILTPDGPRAHLFTGRRTNLDGHPALVCFAVDVTQRRRFEEELHTLSLRDELTGLYNRRGFAMLAEQQLKVARRTGEDLAIAFMDVDDLKLLNDACGHSAGDLALHAVGQAMRATFRDADVVARQGGDEFVALVVGSGDLDEASLVSRLNARLVDCAAAENLPCAIRLSLGLVRFDPSRPETLKELLARADAAMYERKRSRQH
jgi:diguanylate cyclase (GGDEF)-like protein/PAS domain S-box-containing protein